jgi:signal peptidase II
LFKGVGHSDAEELRERMSNNGPIEPQEELAVSNPSSQNVTSSDPVNRGSQSHFNLIGATVSTGAAVMIGYVCLFLGLVLLDQTTKFHSEKAFMTWSDDVDLRSFRSTSTHIFALGVPPGLVQVDASQTEVSENWLDVQLTYVRNPGAAWGAFGDLPDSFRLALFYGITIFVTGFILYLLKTSHSGQRLTRTALIFILAGAVGNVVDRLLLTYVIDWIHFHWKIFGWEYSFPVFNVADMAINAGVALMLLDIVVTEMQLKAYAKNQNQR